MLPLHVFEFFSSLISHLECFFFFPRKQHEASEAFPTGCPGPDWKLAASQLLLPDAHAIRRAYILKHLILECSQMCTDTFLPLTFKERNIYGT